MLFFGKSAPGLKTTGKESLIPSHISVDSSAYHTSCVSSHTQPHPPQQVLSKWCIVKREEAVGPKYKPL